MPYESLVVFDNSGSSDLRSVCCVVGSSLSSVFWQFRCESGHCLGEGVVLGRRHHGDGNRNYVIISFLKQSY